MEPEHETPSKEKEMRMKIETRESSDAVRKFGKAYGFWRDQLRFAVFGVANGEL